MRIVLLRARAEWLVLIMPLVLALFLVAFPPDAGAGQGSWSKLDLNGLQVNVVAADPNDPNVLFAGTFGQGIFRSLDGGQNWAQVNTGLANLFVNDILIDPTNTNNLLTGTGRGPAVGEPTAGIYRSVDRGFSWARVQQTGATLALAFTPQSPNVIYAAGGPPVFKSVDSGATWSQSFQPGTDIVNVDIRGITVDPADANILLAAGTTEGGQGQVFRSTNAGATWDRVLAGQSAIFDIRFVQDLRAGVLAFFGSQTGVFRSSDAGLNWQLVSQSLGDIDVRRIDPNPLNGNDVAIATNRGVFRSTDTGNSWAQLDSTLGNQDVRDVSYNRATPQTIFAGTTDGAWAFTFTAAPTATPTATPIPATPTPTPPAAGTTFFFAEGSTQPPFETWFLVQNPTGSPASVRFTFSLENATVVTRDVTVGANSRFSLFMNPILPNVAFSTQVTSSQQVFVERSMFVGFDGSSITGVSAPSRTWLFAEGATVNPFQTWVLVQNPNSVPAGVTITYLLPDRPPVVQSLGQLAPTSRTSIFVNQVLPNEEFSIRVDSDQPVMAERSLFRFPGNAAATTAGATSPSQEWSFAEGSSLGGARPVDTFLLLQNPQQVAATVTVTLFSESGQQASVVVGMPPNSRRTIFLNDLLPNASFGFRVVSTEPIVAERSQTIGTEPRGFTGSLGASSLATQWNLAEGSTQAPFSTTIAVLNPNSADMSVRMDFQLENGQVVSRDFLLAGNRKLSVNMGDILSNNAFSTKVTTSLPSVVERTMFLAKLGSTGATNAVGVPAR